MPSHRPEADNGAPTASLRYALPPVGQGRRWRHGTLPYDGRRAPSTPVRVPSQFGCSPGTAACGDVCLSPAELLSDASNCGACGAVCACFVCLCSQGLCLVLAPEGSPVRGPVHLAPLVAGRDHGGWAGWLSGPKARLGLGTREGAVVTYWCRFVKWHRNGRARHRSEIYGFWPCRAIRAASTRLRTWSFCRMLVM